MDMRTRKHHNNNGLRSIKTGQTERQVKRIARELGISRLQAEKEKVAKLEGWLKYLIASKGCDGSRETNKEISDYLKGLER
jgi:hypothetical protein